MLKSINQVIVFLLEIAMIVSLAYYGYHKSTVTINRYLLAFVLPAAAIVLWAIFAAPKSSNRLALPYLVIFTAAMFLIASFLLYWSGHKTAAIVMALLAIITQIVSYNIED